MKTPTPFGNPPKSLRHYRRTQEEKRIYYKGADFEDWLLREAHNSSAAEQALWRAVLLQLMTDAITHSSKPDQIRQRREARLWLKKPSADFCAVCEYAGYDPAWLQGRILAFLAKHDAEHPPHRRKQTFLKIPMHANGFYGKAATQSAAAHAALEEC